jgi:hypothetical protein
MADANGTTQRPSRQVSPLVQGLPSSQLEPSSSGVI